MKKKRLKKLTLQRETLEHLDDRAWERFVVGGSDSVPECCCSKASGCGAAVAAGTG